MTQGKSNAAPVGEDQRSIDTSAPDDSSTHESEKPEPVSNDYWYLETDQDQICWLHCDNKNSTTNVLSAAALTELDQMLDEVERIQPKGLALVSDKNNGFIAGADVAEFQTLENENAALEHIRHSQKIFDRLEASRFPTISVIHGFCLGGGLELSLACRYRIAEDDPKTRIGLPEVRLGLHPGYGGTVRLPPLIGAIPALDMMLSGRALSASAANRLGVIDYAVPRRHLQSAARQILLEKPTPTRPSLLKRFPGNRLVRPILRLYMERQVTKRAKKEHYPAPYALLKLWSRFADQPKTMMVEEARSCANLIMGNTAQNLIRVFFLQDKLKAQGKQSDHKVSHVHVIGAGVMGGDIAAWCALRGLNVSLQDQSPDRLGPSVNRAHGLFKKRLKKPRLIQAAMDRLFPDVHGLGLKKADVVIEAIFENLEVKRDLLKDVESKVRPDTLIATNTSSIPLEEICSVLQRPERLVGLHFFNPVAKMQLVEIVQGKHSAQDELKRAAAFALQIGRLPLPVKSTPGFLVNRILMPYLLEAVTLVQEQVPASLVDKAAVEFGMPMGPIELADTVGLDICLSVAEILSQHMNTTVPEVLRDKVLDGQLGRKSGEGFYQYKRGKLQKSRVGKDVKAPSDITDRLMMRLLNEAVACLNEGVISEADLLDAGIIFGTGFAPFRGGPMHYIEDKGLSETRDRLQRLANTHGERFIPDSGWESLNK